MEDNLKKNENGRWPKKIAKNRMKTFIKQVEKKEDNLKKNGRRPNFFFEN